MLDYPQPVAIEIRTCGPGELGDALTPIWQYFGGAATEEQIERMGQILPVERAHVAVDGDASVGGAGSYLFDLTVPGGGQVPSAGVMAVGVNPTHRRRGILTQLMRAQLDAVHERGEPLALLYASEGAIYRRFGYGVSSIAGDIALTRAHARLYDAGDPVGRARLVTEDEAKDLFPQIYDRVQAETPGMFTRTPEWWDVRRFFTPPWMRGEQMRVVVEIGGEPAAYAMYRHEFEAEHMISKAVLNVVEAIGATPAGTREIWRYLIGVDWIETIKAIWLPPDHPLFLLLAEPRRMRFTAGEGLWARLVDVGAALSARGYADGGRVVLDVRDSFCPWNEGHWAVKGGSAEKTGDEADLRLGVDALGSAYLGGFTFAELAWAGRVEELREGALARADAIFRTSRHPWCPEIF
jgi:predicted acetyltransferase